MIRLRKILTEVYTQRISVVFALLFYVGLDLGYSQKLRNIEYNWNTGTQLTDVDVQKYSDYDAVVLKKTYSLKSTSAAYSSNTQFSIYKRVKILTKQGIEQFANVRFRYDNSFDIQFLDARTIKKNGVIVDLNTDDINRSKKLQKGESYTYLVFAVPGVEVGDEIEFIYSYQYNFLPANDDIYMHEEIPILDSEVRFTLQKGILLKINLYNKMEQPETRSYLSGNIEFEEYKWTLKDMYALGSLRGSIPEKQVPYISYVLSAYYFPGVMDRPYIVTPNDWSELVKTYSKNIFNQEVSLGSGADYEKKMIKQYYDTSKTVLENVKLLHEYICRNVKVTPESNTNKTIGKQLEEKEIELRSLYRFYVNYFKKNNIKHYMCLARGKYTGDINLYFPNLNQLNFMFFMFSDKEDNHFLIPKSLNGNFEIDELPYTIEATNCIVFDLENTKDIKFIELPESPLAKNKLTTKCQIELDQEFKIKNFDVAQKYQGQYLTSLKYDIYPFKDDKEKEENIKYYLDGDFSGEIKDIVFNENEGQLNFKSSGNDFISILDDEILAINISKFNISDKLYETTDETKRLLDYYIPYKRIKIETYTLVFPFKAELIEPDKNKISFSNHMGNVNFSVAQKSDNEIVISYMSSRNVLFLLHQNKSILDDYNAKMSDLDDFMVPIKIIK